MRILLAPVVAEETSTGVYPSLSKFIEDLPPAVVPGQPRGSERQNPPVERSATASADAAGGAGGGKNTDTNAAAADKSAADKAAAEAAAKAETEKTGKVEEDWEKAPPPRRSDDWEKWKTNRREAETKFKTDLAERDKTIAEAQAKLKDLETKAPANGEMDHAKAEIERLKAENEAYSTRLLELEVREHPDFKRKYDEPMKELVGRAKKLAGDKADAIERILKMDDSDFKTEQLESLLSDIDSDLKKGQIIAVIEKMDDLKSSRDAAIAETNSWKDNINGQRTQKIEQRKAALEQRFAQTLKKFEDKEKGNPVFQYIEGNAEWNKMVDDRKAAAKALLIGGAKPEFTEDVVMKGLAFDTFVKSYNRDQTKWKEEKTKLEAKVAEMTAANPGAGGGTREEDEDLNRPKITADMDPTAVTAAFAAPLARQIRQAAR